MFELCLILFLNSQEQKETAGRFPFYANRKTKTGRQKKKVSRRIIGIMTKKISALSKGNQLIASSIAENRSSLFSRPTDRRMKSFPIPAFILSCSGMFL